MDMWTEKQMALMRLMQADGYPAGEIAAAVGKSEKAVRAKLKYMRATANSQPRPKGERRDQLCWSCGRSGGLCEWSASKCRVPVPGWDAVPVAPPRGGSSVTDVTPWYSICGCPRYVPG